MEYKFNIVLTKEYFSECFDQADKYGSKWTKAKQYIAVILITLGIITDIYTKNINLTPLFLLVFGFLGFFGPYLRRLIWVKRQMSNKMANTEVEMVITEQALLTKGKFSEANMAWEGMDRILDTPKGLTIWPQKGIKIYIPKNKLNDETINYVLSKFA